MELKRLYSIVKPDEKLSLEDIYSKSKKHDDFEIDSSDYTYLYLLITIGFPSEKEYRVKEIKQNRVAICNRVWRGIKVSFLLKPSSVTFEINLNALRMLINLDVKEFNEEFVKSRDLEVLNFPNPDPDQIYKLGIINKCIRYARSKS